MSVFHENDLISLYLSDLTLLEKENTNRQLLCLYLHPLLGKVLVLNGEIQHIENYQALYHEPLVHLPMCFISNPKTALILGGGSLFAAYETLKYPSIQSVTLCDYDPEVLRIMRKHYEHARKVCNDKRFNYVCEDGINYIKKCNQKFDIIINDCFNLLKESKSFPVYDCLFDLLSSHGVCSDIIYRHIFEEKYASKTIEKIKLHGKVVLSLVTVPEYPGILHIQTIFGKNRNLSQEISITRNLFQKNNTDNEDSVFQLFSPRFLKYYFYVPPYIKDFIS